MESIKTLNSLVMKFLTELHLTQSVADFVQAMDNPAVDLRQLDSAREFQLYFEAAYSAQCPADVASPTVIATLNSLVMKYLTELDLADSVVAFVKATADASPNLQLSESAKAFKRYFDARFAPNQNADGSENQLEAAMKSPSKAASPPHDDHELMPPFNLPTPPRNIDYLVAPLHPINFRLKFTEDGKDLYIVKPPPPPEED
ncbi:hypothetical protein ACH5RR_013954 [Cinchona calisaya]|uniref:LisH domain-containing protein n=1 Tax=Cinchona calisaya TaxID=153742 RepID=A0ABD3A1J5_9GENT